MVKGLSRQVIVVPSPETKLFEQAIFILKEQAVEEGVTQERLMKEAQALIQSARREKKPRRSLSAAFWTFLGSAATCVVWWLSTVL